MTTEIAVLNRLGIALAADSAVRSDAGDAIIAGAVYTRAFDIVDKLFELSSQFPVGVMVRTMNCMGVPWELLVKNFRESEGFTNRPTIDDWTKDFLKYLEGHVLIDEAAAKYEDRIIVGEIQECQLDVDISIGGPMIDTVRLDNDPARIDSLRKSYLEFRLGHWKDGPIAESLKDHTVESIIADYSSKIEAEAKERFTDRALAGPELLLLKEVIANAFLRSVSEPSNYETTLVVAGFGRNETFPAACDLEIQGRVSGKLKFDMYSESIANSPDGGTVVYFAKTKVIERLLEGVDLREFNRMIATMPKREILELAEALASISAQERKAEPGRGIGLGPIDVASITKHEGFVWIKRKSRFEKGLKQVVKKD